MVHADGQDPGQTQEELREELDALRVRLAHVERLEAEHEQAEAKFRGLLEAAPDAIAIADSAGRIVLVNAQTQALFGYGRDELIGQPVEVLVPERFRNAHIGHRTDYVSAPRTRPMGVCLDLFGRRKDGTEVPIEVSLSPVTIGDEVLTISILRDTTERRRMAKALQESRQQLQAIMDNTTASIYAKDRQGRYLFINRRYEELFGVTGPQIAGKTDYDFFPREAADTWAANDRKVLETEVPVEVEETAPQADGLHTYFSLKFPLRGPDGVPYAVCGISTDITGRKRVEEELRVHQRDLEEKIREMDDFMHVVSHDLKEPLRGIEAFAGFLFEDYGPLLDEDGKRYVTFLKQAAVRMRDLINDLLTLASISRKGPTTQTVDLNRILAQVQRDLGYSIQEKHAEIRVVSPLPTVVCDPTQIGEAFKNLISNAVKFNTGPRPTVEIENREEGDAHLISVTDNGIGIDPRYAERIFGLFERLHPQEEFEGTGAGLAICKKVVENGGGRIWVTSQPGKGSTFYFTIPKRPGGHSREEGRSSGTDGDGEGREAP